MNTGGGSFTVLASTNLAWPGADWEVLAPPLSSGEGRFEVTDPDAIHHARRFYRLRWP